MLKTQKQNKLQEEYEEVSNEHMIWKPQIADVLIGKIIKRQKSNFGMSFVIENDDGQYLLPNHQMLEDLLGRCAIGDNVRIVCGETIKTTKGMNLTTYKVFVKKPN